MPEFGNCKENSKSDLILGRLKFTVTSLLCQHLCFRRDSCQSFGAGIFDNGGYQSGRCGDSDRNVSLFVAKQRKNYDRLCPVENRYSRANDFSKPGRVRLGHINQSTCDSLYDEVVHAQFLILGSQGLVEDFAKFQHLVHVDINGEVVMRDLLLRLSETSANSATHVGDGCVNIVGR